ncbi:MAG TPA: glutaconyl-CoA decarboxylase subunit beta, partial [Ruminococcaceae bacterium]|nr:glutaconyl-CoA decarboxylase subunit beta [Oscillospiraceae bacterium]
MFQEFLTAITDILKSSGFATSDWQNYVMIGISCVLLYLAIKKQFEPLLL